MLLSRQATITALLAAAVLLALAVWAVLALQARHRQAGVPSATAPVTLRPTLDLVGMATKAMQSCVLPSPPVSPDASTATLNQMLAARNEFQAYDAATNAYIGCVDAAVDRIAHQTAGQASKSDLESLKLFGARAHNTAIDQEQAYVDQFNVQVRAYKAQHRTF
jgi:hypothetical protein